LRAAAIRALGRQVSPLAIAALAPLVADPFAGGDAACAIARSPSAAARPAIEAMAGGQREMQRLAERAYFVRRFTRGERSARLDALAHELRASTDGRDRVLGTLAAVAFGEISMAAALADPDPRVRRAAAADVLARQDDAVGREVLLIRLARETDATTRIALAAGLGEGDPRARLPLSMLIDRATRGEPDAAMAALALAQRSDEVPTTTLEAILGSRDPVVRAQAMRGLGRSASPDAPGRLVAAYAWEGDAAVRRTIVAALAARGDATTARVARRTFELAASLDPDAVARWTAARALAGRAFESTAPQRAGKDVLWVHLVPAAGASPLENETAEVDVAGGFALPVAFDDDGYALVPGVDPGEARLQLAPRLPPYSASLP
jgi:hypothetical protein